MSAITYSPILSPKLRIYPHPNVNTKAEDIEKIEPKTGAKKGRRIFIYVVACIVNIACYATGVAFGWASPELPKLSGHVDAQKNPLKIPASPTDQSWIASLISVGGALGPFTVGLFMDKIGRKLTLLLSMVPLFVSFIMFAYADNVYYFYLGRFLSGLGTGSIITVVPFYITEISEVDIRGSLGTFMQIFIILGALSATSIAPILTVHLFNLISVIPILVFVTLFAICPESPYYLLMKGDEVGAERSLKKLRIKSEYEIQNELVEIKWTLEKSMANKGGLRKIFAHKEGTKAFVISLLLVLFQQLSGIAAIGSYTQDIFASSGSTIPPQYYAIIMTGVQLISALIAPLLIEKSGRRKLLFISYIGCGISIAVIGYYFYMKTAGMDITPISWLPLVAFIVFNLCFTIGMGPVPWAMISELLSSNIKGVAASVIGCLGSLTTFAIIKLFIDFSDLIGIAGCFWFFAGMCMVALVVTWMYIPETSGKSLQEIQDLLKGVKHEESNNQP